MPERITTWAPGDIWEIALADKTGKVRTEADMDAMMEEIVEVANKYGFNPQSWGGHRARVKLSLIELGTIVDIYHHMCDLDAKNELVKKASKKTIKKGKVAYCSTPKDTVII